MSAAQKSLPILFIFLTLWVTGPAQAQPPSESSATLLASADRALTDSPRALRGHRPSHRRWPRRPRLKLLQLASGPGFHVLNPDRAWGQPLAVWRINEVLCAYVSHFPDAAPVLVQDLSKRGGGRLEPHSSHRRGWDVDIGVVRKGRSFDRFVAASPRTMDAEKTWWLIQSFIRTGDVQYVFLNKRLIRPLYRYAKKQGISRERMLELFHYPRRSRWGLGIIRAEPGHNAHFHVRFLRKRPSVPEPVL